VLTAQVSAVLSTGASVRSVSARDVWVPDATLEEAGKPKAAMPCSERDSVFEHRCCGWSLECVVGWWKRAGELLSTVWSVNGSAQASVVLSTGASARSVSSSDVSSPDVWVPDVTPEEAWKPKAAMPCSGRDSVFEHCCCGSSLACVVGWWKRAGELLSTVWIVNDSAGTVNDSALSHGVG